MRFLQVMFSLILSVVLYAGSTVCAGPMVELSVPGHTWQGLNIAHNDQYCWLALRSGEYERVTLSDVKSYKKLSNTFRPITPSAMAGDLRGTLGRKLDIETMGHFVICAPPGQVRAYGELLASVEKSFTGYFNRRGWPLVTSDFPLVVIVYPTRSDFDQACVKIGSAPTPSLRGFYHPQTNQVILYDQASETRMENQKGKLKSSGYTLDEASRRVAIHETIHQLAFNAGLHQRIGENPRWVVEGLATVLEAGALSSTDRSDTAGRINQDRLLHFQEFRSRRRQGTIVDLVTHGDELYKSAPLDFYSEAWAFTFYLSEARRPDYVRYLKKIAARDPMSAEYSPHDRLADFQSIFGKDLRWMETKFQRFIDELQ